MELNKIEAAQWEADTKERMDAEKEVLAKWKKEEAARLEQEQKEVAQWLKEKEEGERRMKQIEEERRIEDEEWAQRQRAEEEERVKAEEERLRREAMEAEDAWDGPKGECVWNGEDELKHKGDALVYDKQCQVLSLLCALNMSAFRTLDIRNMWCFGSVSGI